MTATTAFASGFSLRRPYRQALWRLQAPRLRQLSPEDLAASAIVFAPHMDDETLACGGTILKKKRLGADLRVVYITDGRQSHARYMPWEELSARRAREAEAAMERLGLQKDDLTFLNFPDGDLKVHFPAAVERVAALLREAQPRQVFMPYLQDPQPAHLAASAIVTAALRRSGSTAAVFEYPVWFWDHWPWVGLRFPTQPPARRTLKNTLRFALGLGLLSAFNRSLDTRDVLEDKCAALDCYETQVRRPPGIPAWPVLGEVSGGEWLACFLREREIFRSAA